MFKKKTIFLCFSISDGSVSDHFVALSNKLSERYNVIIVSDKRFKNEKINKNITVKHWPSNRPTKLIDFIFYVKLLKINKPTLTLSLFGSNNINIIASFLLNVKYRIAWIRSLSDQISHTYYKKIRKSFVYKLANVIATNSKATADDSVNFYKINKNKIWVLPNSVVDYFEQYNRFETDADKILYVGRLHPSKGVEVLLKAFERINSKFVDLNLIILGSGPQKKDLIQLCQNLNITEKVVFKGSVNKDKVLREMKSSYLTVVPSFYEAFGYTVIEAMSMKTCVIGADNTGIKEIIRDRETGLLFETGNSKDLALKIKNVLSDKKFRNELAENGYKHFKENYSTENAVERDANFLIDLIENS